MLVLNWLRGRDRGFAALRRAGRTAVVMPLVFALSDKVIANPVLATFAAFGSFALLLLVDFSGPMRDRLQAQATLGAVGAVFVVIGTLASRETWLAVASMAIVGFAVVFAGVVSSVLAGATTSLLLAFILPVCRCPGRCPPFPIGWRAGGSPPGYRSWPSPSCGRRPPGTRCAVRPSPLVARWPIGCAPTSRSCSGTTVRPAGRSGTKRSPRRSRRWRLWTRRSSPRPIARRG